MPTTDRDDAWREGHEMGGQPAMTAIDCPYLPPDPRRTAWMRGFGANRPTASPASDPSSFARRPRGSPPEHPLPPLHEG